MKIAVLCDFDGTVARDDVGNLLFRTFSPDGESADVVRRWQAGEISSRECLEKEASVARVSRGDLDGFLRDRHIDPYFKDFHDFARRRGMEVVIMSDGLDYYIEQILVRNGLGHIQFYANRLRFTNSGIAVEFPWYDMLECKDCGCCKTHHLFRYRENGYYIIYVGDGLSDRCPCETADLVFAKGDLLAHCRSRGIEHVEFSNFRDVEMEVLRRLLADDTFSEADHEAD
jgi:2,3-diketo-5-methylthio-1-phosphopentane phosphatase